MGSSYLRNFQHQIYSSDYIESVTQRYATLIEHLLSRPSNVAPLNEISNGGGDFESEHNTNSGAIHYRPSAANDYQIEPIGHRYYGDNGGPMPEKSLTFGTISMTVNPSSFGAFNYARQLTLKYGELLKLYAPPSSAKLRFQESASQNGIAIKLTGITGNKEGVSPFEDAVLLDDTSSNGEVPMVAKQTFRMVGIGLHCLRTLLNEVSDKSPICCGSALNSLLHLLSALPPEALATEPKEFVVGLYQLLIDLRSSPCEDIATTSSSCMIALAIAYGAPEQLLESALHYLKTILNTHEERRRLLRDRIYMTVPENLYALHRLALQQIGIPYYYADSDWTRWPLTDSNVLCSFIVPSTPQQTISSSSQMEDMKPKYAAIASDGRFIYVVNESGLFKLGTGCGETKLGAVYAKNAQLKATSDSWLACCNNVLYLRRRHSTKIYVLDNETLLDVGEILLAPQVAQGLCCSDGSSFYLFNIQESTKTLIVTALNDCFMTVDDDQMEFSVRESKLLPLGDHAWIGGSGLETKYDSQADEIRYVKILKEAALVLDKNGRVSIGTGNGGRTAEDVISNVLRWNELSIPEAVSTMIPSTDGISALLLCTNGQAYFVGSEILKRTAGIDTDRQRTIKTPAANRQRTNLHKPQRVAAPNNRRITGGACSNGTILLLTENGRLFVVGVGKNAPYSNPITGQVFGLENVHVFQVAMGKTHAVCVTRHGHVYTFGANHLGQCGRAELATCRGTNAADSDSDRSKTDDDSSARADGNSTVTHGIVAGWCATLNAAPIRLCAPSDHIWLRETATICTACGFCSARGYDCPQSKDKPKGSACGCGPGLSGCVKCGVCRTCGKQYHRASGSERDSEGESVGAQPYPQLMPAKLTLRPIGDCRAAEVACGNYHTIIRTTDGNVVTFGSNRHGQLGVGDIRIRIGPQFVLLPTSVVVAQVAAGANHCVVRTTEGMVYTFGKHHNGQLGRDGRATTWFAAPGLVEGFGAESKKTATWVTAGGDITLIIYEQNLFTSRALNDACVTGNHFAFTIFPKSTKKDRANYFILKRSSGNLQTSKIAKLKLTVMDAGSMSNRIWTLDPHYNAYWSYCPENDRISCHVPTTKINFGQPSSFLQNQELWIPMKHQAVAESQVGLSLLASYYALVTSRFRLHGSSNSATGNEREQGDNAITAGLKENSLEVCRFQSFGGGWGYSLQSVEAIQFCVNKDIWILGYGLFGGRGEYLARIKLLKNNSINNDEEDRSVETLAETDEILYECSPKEKCHLFFGKPVCCRANRWYIAWASVNGPSSDCGAGGMMSVLTEDGVTFYFRNSRLSNNGTDVHVGQIPLILYSPFKPTTLERPSFDSPSSGSSTMTTLIDKPLSQRFYLALTPKYLSMLVELLSLSADIIFSTTSSVSTLQQQHTSRSMALTPSDLEIREFECERAATIAIFCLRLLKLTINLLCPKNRPLVIGEKQEFIPGIGECSDLVLRILDNELADDCVTPKRLVLMECREFVLDLFHLLFPSPASVCSYMQTLMRAPNQGIWAVDTFLTAVSHSESPVICLFTLDYSDSVPVTYPLLAAHLQKIRKFKPRGNLEFVTVSHFLIELLFDTKSNQELADRSQVSTAAVELLIRLTADLVQSVGDDSNFGSATTAISMPTLFQTPKRFGRTSSTMSWDTGGGSPDAIAFQVDRTGVSIHGAGIYFGFGTFTYSLELLVNQGDHVSEKWLTLEKSSGSVDARECANDIVYVKFHKPVTVEPHSMYALRLRMNGGRSWNGECGMTSVSGYKGIRFTFFPCTQSLNGTSVNRGQLPTILYSFSKDTHSPHCVDSAQAVKWILSLIKSLVVRLESILQFLTLDGDAPESEEYTKRASIFESLKILVPRFFAHLSIFVERSPLTTFDVASSFDELLMTVFSINSDRRRQLAKKGEADKATVVSSPSMLSPLERVDRIAIESDHPYKPCKVYSYVARFDLDVAFMTIEFDVGCCTSQPEDTVQLYLTSLGGQFYPIAKIFGSPRNWPKSIILLPGNCVWFILETASENAKAETSSMYGFKCLVTGYAALNNDALFLLETELVNLSTYCCRQLVEKTHYFSKAIHYGGIEVGQVFNDSGDIRSLEEETDDMVRDHLVLLRKGLHLDHAPTVHELIIGKLPLRKTSPELRFLRDFISATASTAGGKLARWLMPEAYVDPKNCEMVLDLENIRSGQTVVVTITTKDQYGRTAYASGASVDVYACSVPSPLGHGSTYENNGERRNDAFSPTAESVRHQSPSANVGGLAAETVDIVYQPTYLNKARYISITMMKPAQKWSFEELRLLHFREAISKETLRVSSARDGTYTATWSPRQSGFYRVECRIDGISISQLHNVEVQNGQIVNQKPSAILSRRMDSRPRMATIHKDDTQGVRIRTAPSLQASQIGVIPAGATIFYIDDCENADGVWFRLNDESAVTFCTKVNNPLQAWCLQFNAHLRKTLIIRNTDAMPQNATDSAPMSNFQSQRSVIVACEEDYVVRRLEEAKGAPVRAQPQKGAKILYYLNVGDNVQSVGWVQNADDEIWIQVVDSKAPTSTKYASGVAAMDGYCLVQESNGLVYLEPFLSPESSRSMIQANIHQGMVEHVTNGNNDNGTFRERPGSSTRQSATQTSPGDQQRKLSVNGRNSRVSSKQKPMVKVLPQNVNNHQNSPILTAISPSISDSIRSVFAAVLWHERIVHDAMACSAYLKFHPSLHKIHRQDTANGSSPHVLANENFQSNIPIGLHMLQSLWKEVFIAVQTVIEKHWILPSPPMAVKTPDQRPLGSAMNPIRQDSVQLQFCELCEGWFPQAVTLHMKVVHPGCGSHAGGQGYNSLGRYTGGWTGNCGDGGLGASPWYLLCHRCRTNYLQTTDTQKQRQRRDKARLFRISAGNVEPQRVLKNNAMFLLELNMFDDDESFSSGAVGISDDSGGLASGISGFKSKSSKILQSQKPSDWVVNLFPRQTVLSTSSDESNGAARIRSRDSTHNGPLAEAVGIPDGMNVPFDGHAFASDPGPKVSRTDDEMSLPSSEPTSGQQPMTIARRTRTSSIMAPESVSDFQCLASPSHALQAAVRLDTTNFSVQSTLRRPTIAFVIQHHDLSHVRGAMRLAVVRTILLEYAFQVFVWLLRNGTNPGAVVDVLCHFVTAMMQLKAQHQTTLGTDKTLPHPLKLTLLAGSIRQRVVGQFHAFLQTIAGILRQHQKVSFDALRACLRSFMFQFTMHDQHFILKSKILSTLSSIMSDRRDESSLTTVFNRGTRLSPWSSMAELEELEDLTRLVTIESGSRKAMLPSLLDGTTETFWESGDEEKGKTKILTVRWPSDQNSLPVLLSVYIDNCQDARHRTSQVCFTAIINGEPKKRLKTQTLETHFVGWVKCYVALFGAVCIELKSPDISVRVRQIHLSGVVRREIPSNDQLQEQQPLLKHSPSVIMQFDAVQADAFDLFQLLASNAFGDVNEGVGNGAGTGQNLQQQVLNILFSRNQMHALQSYVSTQMVNALEREILLLRDKLKRNYTYCCGLMTMLSRVISSQIGRQSILSKTTVLTALSELLLFSSAVVQCQALEAMERLVPVFDPKRIAADTVIGNLLILITKALTLQIRQRPSQISRTTTATTSLSEDGRLLNWHAYRPTSIQIAQLATKFLMDAATERFGSAWAVATKTTIANEISALALLTMDLRNSQTAVRQPAFWSAAGALCVCQHHDWLQFSPSWRSLLSKASAQKILCENHEDGRTLAIMYCEQCKLHMCADCSSILHLNRKTRTHEMQHLATADTQIQVIVHETCSRLKMNWLLLSVDRSTMNGMAEFRSIDAMMHASLSQQRSVGGFGSGVRHCRFCDYPTANELNDVCTRAECQNLLATACRNVLACGHVCGGVANEEDCPPCLRCHDASLRQDSDDMCVICFTETLSAAPIVQLACTHVFHYHCCRATLSRRWPGPRMTFGFMCCPICKVPMDHPALQDLLVPLVELKDDVRRKAIVRLEYDGLAQSSQVTSPGGPYFNDPASFAMDRYAYYLCHKCQKPYFGGEAQCQQLNNSNDYNPMELLCGGCSDVARAQICPRHGSAYLEYKCRYCCSIAVFFCFGTTHFCAACHDDFQRLIALPREQLPPCPVGPRSTPLESGESCPLKVCHPPTGEEFALGCGICRNLSSF